MSELIRLEQKLDKGFKTICLEPIENPSLSWRAKGLHTYLISRPPGWKIWYTDLEQRSAEGKAAIRTAVKELQDAGYLRIDRIPGESGKIAGSRWIIAQTPSLMTSDDQPHTDCPYTEEPDTDSPHPAEPHPDCPHPAEPHPGNPPHNKKVFVLSNTSSKDRDLPSDKPKISKEDLNLLTEHYASIREARPRGNAWLPIQQGFKQMVIEEGYKVEQVIGCMDRLKFLGWTWTINTVRKWIADYVAGAMPENNSAGLKSRSNGETHKRDANEYEDAFNKETS